MNVPEDPEALRKLVAFALEKYPQRIEMAAIENLILDAARESGKRPAYLKIAVPDETVKGLRGRKTPADRLILVRIPRETEDRASSPIILPNEIT
ncbi:MAG: hypothetical protein OEM62_01230 [Acidobacteriota bacterium]|nr:hypothetical protein [Acidobacteriota bacterium]